jgi:hypothetical protein
VSAIKAGRPSGKSNVTPKLLEKLRDKPETVRVTMDLPVELHTKLKLYAVRRRETIIGVLREMIRNLPDD